MSRERFDKRKTTALAPSVSTKGGGVYATLHRNQNSLTAEFENGELPQADSTLAVDCGCAVLHEGYPELRLGQRHPLKSNQLTRLIVVRYTVDIFTMRAQDNESFRDGLEKWLSGLGPEGRGPIGFFSEAVRRASDSEPITVTVDADGEWMLRSGHRGAIIFISTTSWERYKATIGKSDSLWFYGSIEVTMPARVMADLLDSWKSIADTIKRGSKQ